MQSTLVGDHFFENLVTDVQKLPYSLMLDSSNDNGLEKTFPVTVRIYDVNFGRVLKKFIDMNLLEGRDASTAEVMFQSVDELLERNSLDWDHCLATGADNTNINIGDHNSIKSRANEKK